MAFWGVEVKPGKPHCHQFNNTQRRRLHITRATLGSFSSTGKIKVQCNVGDKAPVFLCCLFPNKCESCHMAFEFEEDEDVIFSVLGPGSVHLAGFYLDKSSGNVNNGDDSDSYGEDIGETESDRCDDDEDEYEDDFIDDGDMMEYYPYSPKRKSGVVIEEMLDDEKPAKVNGNRKRLKKKYQVSDSDGDAQEDIAKIDTGILIIESDDEEGLPLSSVLKIKHQESDSAGNDQKQNIDKGGTSSFELDKTEKCMPLVSVLNTKDGSMQEQSDKKEFMGDKINESQDGGDQITGIKRTIEGCEMERVAGCVRHDSQEKPKKKKKKRPTESQSGRVENELKVDVQEEENFVVEARIDDTSKNELVKDQPVDNLYNDKAFVQASHENVVKTKKKHKKHAKERKTTELGNDTMIDVQEENNQVKEAVTNDFNQEVLVKGDAVDNISIDKAFAQSSHENVLKTKKKHKKHAEEKKATDLGNDSMVDVQEENIQVKEAVKNDFNQEVLVKDDDVDNISFYKAFVQSSRENVVKTNKKHKKHAEDEQTTELGNNSMVDVQEENIQVEEAVISDFNQEVLVKDNATDNIATDKEPGCIGHEIEKPKKKKKKRGKESRNVVVENDSKIDVQEAENCKVEAQIDVISKNEPIKDQANDNLSFDKAVVQSSAENVVKIKRSAKDRQTINVEEDSMSGALKEEKFQFVQFSNQEVLVKDNAIENDSNDNTEKHEKERQAGEVLNDNMRLEEAKSTDINLEDAVKDATIENVSDDNTNIHGKERQAGEDVGDNMIDINQKDAVKEIAIDNVSNDKGVEKPEAEIEIQEKEKPTKKRKKRTKERPTNVVDNICDSQKEAKPLIVKGTTDDITHIDESIQLIEKKDVQGLENSGKVKKKRKQARAKQTSEAGDQSTINSQIDSIIVNQEAWIKETALGESLDK